MSATASDGETRINEAAFKAASEAFRIGPPGVLRRVQQTDSYPGEAPEDPESYNDISTTIADEERALRDFLAAYLRADPLHNAAATYFREFDHLIGHDYPEGRALREALEATS